MSDRSAAASISTAATEPPASSEPPYAAGKASPTWPVVASSLARAVIRVRASVIDSPCTTAYPAVPSFSRAAWRTCAQRPSSTCWIARGSTVSGAGLPVICPPEGCAG